MKFKTSETWLDWRWQLQHALTDLDTQFCGLFGLDPQMVREVTAKYPVRLTPYVLSQLTPFKPEDPLNLQILPHAGELVQEEGLGPDPFLETGAAARVTGVKQRFPDRILVMANDTCAAACRHCTRKGLLGDARCVRTSEQIEETVSWVESHPQVREVLISGGDPLLLPDRKILPMVRAFASLRQIDAVRIGTRVLSTLPMRITPELAFSLGKFRKVWVNTQFNHIREMTAEARRACALLVEAGVPVSNQSVLLKGVNDSIEALFELCTGLQRNRVRPYYVFVCDPIAGISHFRVSVKRACELEAELAERIGGLALPRFVADLPGAKRKWPVSQLPRA